MDMESNKLIFVSHAHEDSVFCQSFVLNLKYALQLDDNDIFYDETTLEPGNEWLEIMHQEINGCPVFILILSNNAASSRFVKREVSLAVSAAISDTNRRIFVLKIDDAPPGEIWSLISSYQVANAHKQGFLQAFHQLTRALETYLKQHERRKSLRSETSVSAKLEQLDALSAELDTVLSDMKKCREVNRMTVWADLSKQAWALSLARDADVLDLLEEIDAMVNEYRELPRQRGNGHTIEQWLVRHDLSQKHQQVESNLGIIRRSVSGE